MMITDGHVDEHAADDKYGIDDDEEDILSYGVHKLCG